MTVRRLTLLVAVVTVAVGLATFFLADGVSGLSSDTGRGGAWFVAAAFQLFHAAGTALGFALFARFAPRAGLQPTAPAAATAAALAAVAANLFGIFHHGESPSPLGFLILLTLLSAGLFALTALAARALGRRGRPPD